MSQPLYCIEPSWKIQSLSTRNFIVLKIYLEAAGTGSSSMEMIHKCPDATVDSSIKLSPCVVASASSSTITKGERHEQSLIVVTRMMERNQLKLSRLKPVPSHRSPLHLQLPHLASYRERRPSQSIEIRVLTSQRAAKSKEHPLPPAPRFCPPLPMSPRLVRDAFSPSQREKIHS